jgi:O-antigen ligase
MSPKNAQEYLARTLAYGGFLTTIFVAAWWTTEPVNAPKMAILSATAGSCLGVLVAMRSLQFKEIKMLISSLIGFSLLASISLITSASPVDLNFFGVGGRNTGLLTYIALAIVLFSGVQLKSTALVLKVLKAFALAGIMNVVYCLFSIAGVELLPWNNIFDTILGTFGNPNFIGAFLGIFGVILLAYILGRLKTLKVILWGLPLLGITFFEIIKSHAIQGLVILALGSSIVVWMKIRSISRNRLIEYGYLLFISVSGLFALLGALQIGPLTKYIYKLSVSLRGEYWQAAWNMGLQHPLTGVGMDSYGDWFRRARDIQALVVPGVNVTTNAAHNVFLDIFAYGGFPLLVAYLAILIVVARSAIKILFKSREYDFVAVALVSGWICYQAQALISINQIGVAIWGWMFGGLIIAYEKLSATNLEDETNFTKNKLGRNTKKKSSSEAALALGSFVGLVAGALIAMPPMIADTKWRNAMGSGDAEIIEAAAKAWPQDPVRLNQAIKMFSDNNFPELALSLSNISISKFSESYISWYSYIQLPGLSESEIKQARAELHRLDPNNPEFK